MVHLTTRYLGVETKEIADEMVPTHDLKKTISTLRDLHSIMTKRSLKPLTASWAWDIKQERASLGALHICMTTPRQAYRKSARASIKLGKTTL
jgi:hypothetical protein